MGLICGLYGTAGAVTTYLFHDAGANCDVYDWKFTLSACDRGARLKVSQSGDVPNGYVPIRLYFKNVPTETDGVTPKASDPVFTDKKLSFRIEGADYCSPAGTYGDDNKGINNVDRMNPKGYYDTHRGQLQAGTTLATDYGVRDPGITPTPANPGLVPLKNLAIDPTLTPGTFRVGDDYCLTTGTKYSQWFAATPQYLKRGQGLSPGVFYMDIIAQTADDIDRSGENNPNYWACDTSPLHYEQSCAGIENAFRVWQEAGTYNGLVTGGNKQSVTLVRYATFFANIALFGNKPGFMQSFKTVREIQVNLTFQSGRFKYFGSIYKSDPQAHTSYSFPFAPDCSLLQSPTQESNERVVLYDVDYTTDPLDKPKALVLRYATDGTVSYLKTTANDNVTPQGYEDIVSEANISTTPTVLGTWTPLPDGVSDTLNNPGVDNQLRTIATTLIDHDGTYQSLNFKVKAGERYKFVILNMADRRVAQVGLPFDAAFDPSFGVAKQLCGAKLTPDVGVNVVGANYTVSASVNNTAPIKISAPGGPSTYTRTVYFKNASGAQVGGTTTLLASSQTYTALVNTNLGNVLNPAPTPVGATSVCTKLILAANTTITYRDENAAQIYPEIGPPAESCAPLTANIVPFFNVLGGDVLTNGNIRAKNSSGTSGAYAQIALILDGKRDNFAGGVGLPRFQIDTASDISFMTFANKHYDGSATILKNGEYGPNGAVPISKPNWVVPSPTTNPGVSLNLATANGDYYATSNVGLYGALPASKKVRLYVKNANVSITNNINYGTATKLSDIPQLKVFVDGGNIIVSNSVTEVHGVFYTRLSGGQGGKFYTCGVSGVGVEVSSLNSGPTYTNCGNTLTVYGAVSADQLILARTNSTVSAGVQQPAETFYFTPESWFGPSSTTYDSFTNLPPVL